LDEELKNLGTELSGEGVIESEDEFIDNKDNNMAEDFSLKSRFSTKGEPPRFSLTETFLVNKVTSTSSNMLEQHKMYQTQEKYHPPMEQNALRSLLSKGRVDVLLKPRLMKDIFGRRNSCEYCGKLLYNTSSLKIHERSHTGIKPYKYDKCGYACAQSSKLKRHMRMTIGMGKHKCIYCDMPFSVATTFEKNQECKKVRRVMVRI
jgi:hypothetical protein